MDIPVSIFAIFLGMALTFLVVGLSKRIGVAILMSGMFILTIAVATDNITIDTFLDGGTDDIIHYNMMASTGVVNICGNGGVGCNDITGEYVSSTSSMLYGDTIDCIDTTLRKTGAPTGFGFVGVWDSSQAVNDPIKQQFGTFDASTLPSGFSEWFTFCLPEGQTYTIGNQDVIGIRYDGGTATDAVRVLITTTDNFDGTTTFQRTKVDATNVWGSSTANDFTALFYLRGETSVTVPNNFEFTELIKVLFSLIGIMLMLIGVLYYRNE